jgi:glycosyltransferase involved in cell wall biosynthesis
MRVLTVGNMYPPHHQGGYELVWQACVAELRAHGHEVRVLTTDHREAGVTGPDEPDVHRELRWYWRDHDFPRLGPLDRWRLERANARCLRRHLDEFRPEAVAWFAMGGMSLALVEAVRRRGLPALAVACDDWVSYAPRVDQWTRLWEVRPRLARLADPLTGLPTSVDLARAARWAFLSDALRRRAAHHDARFAAGEVVHRGPDADLFPRAPEREWGWRLLYAGRVEERKGVDTAVRALAHLPAEAVLTVDGPADPAHRAQLERLAGELGVAARVRFARSPRERLADAYAAADAVLFPVRWEEPWGLVPLEAMCVGRPVVASGMGGSAEYLRDGENCLTYAPADDAEALAARVRELAADAALRSRLREGGFETARSFEGRPFERRVRELLEGLVAAR